ncbi:MAG: SRPBCC family protein [Microthrixaceae bacterium]
MKHELVTEIEIEAKPQQVWSELVDLEAWSEWNPFIIESSGVAEVGAKLINRMQVPETRAMTFKPTVTEVREAHSFEWLGHLGIPGLFDGRHRFELHETECGTTLVQSEEFSGILVRFVRRSLYDNTTRGFGAMNEALKARVERPSRAAAEPLSRGTGCV